jgi:hypothetical protein
MRMCAEPAAASIPRKPAGGRAALEYSAILQGEMMPFRPRGSVAEGLGVGLAAATQRHPDLTGAN